MADVQLLLPALPAHVRTARLVTVAAARRAGLADELVDELRLAVGEACARAVGLHVRYAPAERVSVTVSDSPLGLTVRVTDCGPEAGPAVDDVTGGLLSGGATGGAGSGDAGAGTGGGGDSGEPDGARARLDDDLADPDVALALLTGLVDEVEVERSADGTTVSLTWPLRARPHPTPLPRTTRQPSSEMQAREHLIARVIRLCGEPVTRTSPACAMLRRLPEERPAPARRADHTKPPAPPYARTTPA